MRTWHCFDSWWQEEEQMTCNRRENMWDRQALCNNPFSSNCCSPVSREFTHQKEALLHSCGSSSMIQNTSHRTPPHMNFGRTHLNTFGGSQEGTHKTHPHLLTPMACKDISQFLGRNKVPPGLSRKTQLGLGTQEKP